MEDAFVKGFISYYALQRELKELEERHPDSPFRPLEKLNRFFERGIEKQISHPEAYAVKNWIVSVQGFLISCATFEFTSN